MEQEMNPIRTRATWKPRTDPTHPSIYADAQGEMLLALGGEEGARFNDAYSSRETVLPYQVASAPEGPLEKVPFLKPADLPEGFSVSYQIVGGYDASAIRIYWKIPFGAEDPETGEPYEIRWAMLKTFTGILVKYVTPGKRAPLVFALADEDAYVYCDEPFCKECTFRCKQGFVVYAYIKGIGVVCVPVSPNKTRDDVPA